MAVPKAIAVPFQISKDLGSPVVNESDKVLEDSIRTILLTLPGERPYRPTFGSWLRALVFANMTQGNAIQASQEIERAIGEWEPRVSVRNIQFELDVNKIKLFVTWRPNGRQQDSTTFIGFDV